MLSTPSDAAPSGAVYREEEQATSRSRAPDKTGTWMAMAQAGLAQFVTRLLTMVSRATMRRLSRDRRRSGAHQRPRAERDPRSPRRRRADPDLQPARGPQRHDLEHVRAALPDRRRGRRRRFRAGPRAARSG